MRFVWCVVAVLIFMDFSAAQSRQKFQEVLLTEVTEAAKLYFSRNTNLDDTGFNIIDADDDWTATQLFGQQYGEGATTARFVAALLDFEYFEHKNVSFSDVVQLILVGEHQDARKAFAAYALTLVRHYYDDDLIIDGSNIARTRESINTAFRSTYDNVGNKNFASFLNLQLGSSLSFVMDTTGSMAGEIGAAKARVVDIINKTNGTSSAPLNYVLVPFNDPAHGPVTKTSDPSEFITAVNSLTATGGGDLPELAMIGIQKAVQNSGFRSIVYVFTDAPEKDTWLQNHVIALCLVKKVSVYIFLTTNISRRKRSLLSGRRLYDNIAELTGGSVMFVQKADINAGTAIMEATTVQGLVMLVSKGKTNATSVSVKVDSSVSNLIVQFTGTFEYLGYSADRDATEVELTSIDGVKLFRLEGVEPGVYTFNFNGATMNEYGVLIRGKSTLGFHAFLSQKKRGTDTFVASRQLQAGQATRAELTVYGDADNVEFTTFQLISRDGHILVQLSLNKESDMLYKPMMDFKLPNEPMVVKLIGSYKGMPLERIDPCAITPTVSESILEDIGDLVIRAGDSLQVTTTLHNKGGNDDFNIQVTDNKEFVSIVGAGSNGLEFTLRDDEQRTITLNIAVRAGTQQGVVSKVLLSATGVTDNYFLFTTFVVSVIDDVTRCPSPVTPAGGNLICSPDGRSVGSVCQLRCGDEYLQEGPSSITCQDGGKWSPDAIGMCKYRPSQTCTIAGDPHYTTFDGRTYDFMGSCLYTLVKTQTGESSITPVTIQTENGLFYGTNHVSWFKQAFVTINGTTITMKKGPIIFIEGERITVPIYLDGGRIQIKRDGGDVLLQTDFRMEVRLNRRHYFRVSLPVSYTNRVSGLCGNYDGDMNNDLMVGNVSFTDSSEFGNELEIVGGSNAWCRKGQPGDNDKDCENEAKRAIYAEKCAAIKSECFQSCAEDDHVDRLFQDCIFDMCAFDGAQKILEGHISEFASECSDKGLQICNWRIKFGFPTPTCGKNMQYKFRSIRCPNTCVDREASKRCESKPKAEGCVCSTGYLLEGEKCIRQSECGCAVQGRYYPNGISVIQAGCNMRCMCSGGAWSCEAFSCDDDRECRVSPSGVRECQLKRVDQCYATGDPHYRTLDGSRYNFMGACRYVMLSTNGAADFDRRITVTAQNERRGGHTSVSYVRAVFIDIKDFQIKLGPGKQVQVMKNGSVLQMDAEFSADDGLFSAGVVGREARCSTKFGIAVKFNGMNLFIDVPSYYMNKVSGLCGNYTGDPGDDFGEKDVKDFAADHIFGDGCEEDPDLPDFVCSDAEEAKWRGAEFCGKLKAADGPFQYCTGKVNVDAAFENCVFDACVTGGDRIQEAIQAFAQECNDRDRDLLPCDWETMLGVEQDCPLHSRYDGCASRCVNTCRNPVASDNCRNSEILGRCVCDLGYVMHEGNCVNETTCGCVVDDEYVEQGFTKMEPSCTAKKTCTSSGNLEVERDPCGENSKCKELEDDRFSCVPDEFAYALIYAAIHYKTFDGKFFDFHGTCGYLLAGFDSDHAGIPGFKVFVKNKIARGGVKIDKVMVEIWGEKGVKRISLHDDKRVLVDGTRFAFGSKVDSLTISRKRGNAVLDFAFGLSIHFNGEDWLRVDISDDFWGKMHGIAGNYNGDDHDDSPKDDMTPEKWGDMWRSEDLSSDECSKTTPTVDVPCAMRRRYERSCDCGMISDPMGPFAACHVKMNPHPFMLSCVIDACLHDGSARVIGKVMKAYYIACLGKGVLVDNWREHAKIEMECPMNSHYDNCTNQCQPSCRDPSPACHSPVCEEGCVCDEDFIMSDGKCVPEDKCGCMGDDGRYFEHGFCRSTGNCSEKCTCIYGDWNCEDTSCNEEQMCGMRDGISGCHWKDTCKYENGGCSDFCSNSTCSCKAGRILTRDSRTCVDISPNFFAGGKYGSCDSTFNIWKAEFLTWQHNYLPAWQKELEAYKQYVKTGILSMDIDVCQYSWTKWYDRDDPAGCGDEESLELLRVDYPEICEKPIAAEGRMADGRKLGAAIANFEVTRNGLVCKNAEQERDASCPDFAVRFLCRVPNEIQLSGCGA